VAVFGFSAQAGGWPIQKGDYARVAFACKGLEAAEDMFQSLETQKKWTAAARGRFFGRECRTLPTAAVGMIYRVVRGSEDYENEEFYLVELIDATATQPADLYVPVWKFSWTAASPEPTSFGI